MEIKKLIVKNCQSIKDIELTLERSSVYAIRGDSIDNGKNNIGKTTLLNTIELLANNVSNANRKYYLRRGEDTMRIELHDFADNYVILSRGKDDFYEWCIDGKKRRLDNTGGKVPQAVREYLNFYYVEKSKTKTILLNALTVEQPMFFVDTTPTEDYNMLKEIIGTDDAVKALKELKEEKKELTVERKYALKEKEDLESTIKITKSDVSNQEKSLVATLTLEKELDKLLFRRKVVFNYASKLKEVRELKTKVNGLNVSGERRQFEEVWRQFNLKKKLEDTLATIQFEMKTKKEIKELEHILIKDKETLDEVIRLNHRRQLLDSLVSRHANLEEVSEKLRESRTSLEDIKQEKQAYLEELGICPLCNQEVGVHTHV